MSTEPTPAAPTPPAPVSAAPPKPAAPAAPVAVGFNAEQSAVIGHLSTTLTFVAPLMLLVGALRLTYGVVVIWKSSWNGIWILPEGALLAFAGLALIAGATDARFLRDVKGREKEHLVNTFESVNAAFTALLILGCYVAVVAFFRVFF